MGGKSIPILAAIAAAHFALAVLIGERPLASYFTAAWFNEVLSVMMLPAIAWFVIRFIRMMRYGTKRPSRYMRRVIYVDRHWFLRAGVLLGCYILVNRAYRALKVAIPRLNDFYADPYFIKIDRAIFGTDPWRITHAIFGPEATGIIDFLYVLWVPVIVLMFVWAIFSRDRHFQFRAASTYLVIWILIGNVLATLLASVGPCFYDAQFDSTYFAPLMEQLHQIEGLRALKIQEFLLSATGDESIGAGISAMPSVHVAMTTLLVLMAWDRFGPRWQTGLALAYHVTIFVGSVHLAWHYAVDGMLSMALVALLWFGIAACLNGPRKQVAIAPADQTDSQKPLAS